MTSQSTWLGAALSSSVTPALGPPAGALEATSLGAYGPLFDSSYVFNATYAQQVLNASDIVFPNTRIAQGAPSLASSAESQKAPHANSAICKPMCSHPLSASRGLYVCTPSRSQSSARKTSRQPRHAAKAHPLPASSLSLESSVLPHVAA